MVAQHPEWPARAEGAGTSRRDDIDLADRPTLSAIAARLTRAARARPAVSLGLAAAVVVVIVATVTILVVASPDTSSPTGTAGQTTPRSTAPVASKHRSGATTLPPRPKVLSIRVAGKHLIDANGKVLQLRGVNRASTEYRCVQDVPFGFITDDNSTDGTSAAYVDEVVSALRTWNAPGATSNAINAVRIPLNEDCWLGINGAAAAYSGAPYKAFIKAEVDALVAAGMYPILDLHWTAPAGELAKQQDVAPNAQHSLPFWTDVAETFKHSPAVVFDLFNEPRLWCYSTNCANDYGIAADYSWACYRDGCPYVRSPGDNVAGETSGQFQVVGTQTLVNAIRAQGAGNVILIEGLGYANALDNWVKYKPIDPLDQIAAEVHMYGSSGANVNNTPALDNMLGSGDLSTYFPVVVGEFGESLCGGASTGFTERTMTWADNHGYSYTAWSWDKGEGCSGPSLVTSNAGAVSAYGTVVRSHLQQQAARS